MENKKTSQIINGGVWFTDESSRDTYLASIEQYSQTPFSSSLVPKRNFVDQLKAFLSDRSLFGNLDNLNINRKDFPNRIFEPFAPEEEDPTSTINEMMSASWYKDTVRRRNLGPNDFLLVLMLYIDKPVVMHVSVMVSRQ